MCGIAGYKLRNARYVAQAFQLFTRLMEECQVRGRHASGVSWVRTGRVVTHKVPLPARELLASHFWGRLAQQAPTALIGHTRYSTSGDWQNNDNNQPVATTKLAVVHNGLVSMAEKRALESSYGVRLTTANDTEIILRRALAAKGDLPKALKQIYAVAPPIFACGFLDAHGRITVMRDHIRPLWLWQVPEWGLSGFASTRDIIMRATQGMSSLRQRSVVMEEAEPYVEYSVGPDGAQKLSTLAFKQPAEIRWRRPNLTNAMLHGWQKQKVTPKLDDGKKQYDHRKQLRRSFKEYCVASISTWEIDPNYSMLSYLFKRYELSKSQEYWWAWAYAVFYQPGTLFYFLQEFPEYEKVDRKRLDAWHKKNWRALQYNSDRKWAKGHLVEMFDSYVTLMGGQHPTAQEEFFTKLLTGDPTKDFQTVTSELRRLLEFGRYATYIYTECLARCMGLPISADTFFLREADSPRHGLAIALGKPEWGKGSLTAEQWSYLEREGIKLMREVQQEHPKLGMDFWFMESCLCSWKGFFRPTRGRYVGYYLDRMHHEIEQMAAYPITSGVEWDVLKQFRKESFPPEYVGELAKPPRYKVEKAFEHVLRDQGRMIGLSPMIERGLLK